MSVTECGGFVCGQMWRDVSGYGELCLGANVGALAGVYGACRMAGGTISSAVGL